MAATKQRETGSLVRASSGGVGPGSNGRVGPLGINVDQGPLGIKIARFVPIDA